MYEYLLISIWNEILLLFTGKIGVITETQLPDGMEHVQKLQQLEAYKRYVLTSVCKNS